MIQEVAVVLIVSAAVLFVLRRFGLLGRRRQKPVTFVPLASLRKRAPRRHDDSDACH